MARLTRKQEQQYNRDAAFEPSSRHPTVVVAGLVSLTYVESGRFVVSVHCDTGNIPDTLLTNGDTVPLTITVNGNTVFDSD